MAQNTVYSWPGEDRHAVCKNQHANAGDNLILNGTMSVGGGAEISFIRTGVSRSVSITSTHDLSEATFTVTGLQNGALLTSPISGPTANGTVYTDEIFDVITSVTVDSDVTHVRVGTGDTGFLPLISVDPNSSHVNIRNTNGLLSFSVRTFRTDVPGAVDEGIGIKYKVMHSLDNIKDNKKSFLDQLDHFFILLDNQTSSQYFLDSTLTNYLLLQVIESAHPVTDSLDLIVMQS
jgi:hypothetical protein